MADDAPFRVSVEGYFTDDGSWAIEATIEFKDGPPPLGSVLLAEGESALRSAIAAESLRGQILRGTARRTDL